MYFYRIVFLFERVAEKEREVERGFSSLGPLLGGCSCQDWPRLSQEVGASAESPQEWQGSKHLVQVHCFSQAVSRKPVQKWSNWYWELEAVPVWNASVAGNVFTHYATMLAWKLNCIWIICELFGALGDSWGNNIEKSTIKTA